MTIDEFLLDRLTDAQLMLNNLVMQPPSKDIFGTLITNQVLLIKWHQNWPVLTQIEPTYTMSAVAEPMGSDIMALELSQKIQWLTRDEYTKKFGHEAPTAPVLRQMAQEYRWHPDYDTDWDI